jgi:hypothetical protein
MHSPFDILKKEPEGSFRWYGAASDLESANIRIEELIVLSPGECVVFARLLRRAKRTTVEGSPGQRGDKRGQALRGPIHLPHQPTVIETASL